MRRKILRTDNLKVVLFIVKQDDFDKIEILSKSCKIISFKQINIFQ